MTESVWAAVVAGSDQVLAAFRLPEAILDPVWPEVSVNPDQALAVQKAIPGQDAAASLDRVVPEVLVTPGLGAGEPGSAARLLAAIGLEVQSRLEVWVNLDQVALEASAIPDRVCRVALASLDQACLGVLVALGQDERRVWSAHWGRRCSTKSRYELMP